MKNRRSRLWKVSAMEFKKIVFNSNSYSDIAKYFNYSANSSIFGMIKERMLYEGIELSVIEEAQKKQRQEQMKLFKEKNEYALSEILVENSTYGSNYYLKKRLLKEGLLKEECEKCGMGSEWQGEKLSLQLDHKNGVNDDNRLENLRLLCPNCHSQTPTFCGKHHKVIKKCSDCGKVISKKSTKCLSCSAKENGIDQRRVMRPSRIELIQLILEKPFLQIGKQYGVSDNAVRKWCRFENLPFRKKDINDMREELERELTEALITTQ